MGLADAGAFVSPEGLSLGEIRRLLEAEFLSGENLLERRITRFSSTDLMSHVLAETQPGTLLLTSLSSIQVINTAIVADLGGVVFLGGNRPLDPVIDYARSMSMATLLTSCAANVVCGRLNGSPL